MTRKQKKVLIRILISLALLIILHFIPVSGWLSLVLYMVPYLIIGYDILKKAFLGIINREIFDENFLMAVATIGAICLGEYVEGAAVMLFYQIGELFQSYAVGKSRKNIAALMDIRPDYANIETEDGIEQIDPDEVEVGTEIIVQPGEKIPIDGIVVSGNAALNTSALTGESIPRDVGEGDQVISGCVNMSGVLRIQTTKAFGESTVSKILDLVENSSMKKSRSENFISRFAKVYTPAVCYAAVALATLLPLVRMIFLQLSPAWSDWIFRALTFLVISCPCALVISIPLSFFGGIGGASRCGILVKGSNYLEALSETSHVVFDKTGTLTKGVFEVTGIYPAAGKEDVSLLEIAALAESYSSHPISRSLKEAWGQEIQSERVAEVEEIAGYGVTAQIDGYPVAAGNARLMEKLQVSYEECDKPGTVVYIAWKGSFAGCILIADLIKEQAAQAIAGLKKYGVKKTVMLTGDNERTAAYVGSQLGIDEIHSGLFPADKVNLLEACIQQKGSKGKLAFVGDGINDAPVLTRADIGIAMGAMGSDAAIEAADVVLMDDDPGKIPLAIRLSRRCLGIVRQNIIFALVIKALCLLLGAAGVANMWMAIFADVGVMVIAVLNATRALIVPQSNQ